MLEAKRAGLSHREGVGQAKDYTTRLGTLFAYASNGLRWYGIDMATGAEGDMDLPFPTPDELWDRTFAKPNPWRDAFGAVDFETAGGKWEARYYQHEAINSALEAIARGERRILLTLATGTGKTSIAFQIAWKLFHAKWSLAGEPVRRRAFCSWLIATSLRTRPTTPSPPSRQPLLRASIPNPYASGQAGRRRTPASSSPSTRPS